MNNESHTVVLKPRNYSASELHLDNVACEWMGKRVETCGGGGDLHYEFDRKEWADGFRLGVKAYAI